MADQSDVDEIIPNPMTTSLPEELITDDLESIDEVEVNMELQPYLEEDWDCTAADEENRPNNLPDCSFNMKTLKKLRCHHDLNSDEDSTQETLSEDSDCNFDSVLGDLQTARADDLDATCADFAARPVPGYQELKGDIFRVRQQKKKGYAYALGHCISADAAMSAGIAPKFCAHFPDLRYRVQQEEKKQGTILPIH